MLKLQTGQMMAVHEVIELAVYEFEREAENSSNVELFISSVANKHGLHVHFTKIPEIRNAVIKSQAINIYMAFDAFLTSFRKDYCQLHDVKWQDYSKKTLLEVTLLNLFGTLDKATNSIGKMQIDAVEYYRIVRNMSVHLGKDPNSAQVAFRTLASWGNKISETYPEVLGSPNLPDALSRHDLQLYVRSCLDIAWRIGACTEPTHERWQTIAQNYTRTLHKFSANPKRTRIATMNFLMKTYGLSSSTSAKILGSVQ